MYIARIFVNTHSIRKGDKTVSVNEIVCKYFPIAMSKHIIQQENLREGYVLMGKINTEWANL